MDLNTFLFNQALLTRVSHNSIQRFFLIDALLSLCTVQRHRHSGKSVPLSLCFLSPGFRIQFPLFFHHLLISIGCGNSLSSVQSAVSLSWHDIASIFSPFTQQNGMTQTCHWRSILLVPEGPSHKSVNRGHSRSPVASLSTALLIPLTLTLPVPPFFQCFLNHLTYQFHPQKNTQCFSALS